MTGMPDRFPPRVALLGFSIECNKFARPATKAHFLARAYLEGDAVTLDLPVDLRLMAAPKNPW